MLYVAVSKRLHVSSLSHLLSNSFISFSTENFYSSGVVQSQDNN